MFSLHEWPWKSKVETVHVLGWHANPPICTIVWITEKITSILAHHLRCYLDVALHQRLPSFGAIGYIWNVKKFQMGIRDSAGIGHKKVNMSKESSKWDRTTKWCRHAPNQQSPMGESHLHQPLLLTEKKKLCTTRKEGEKEGVLSWHPMECVHFSGVCSV